MLGKLTLTTEPQSSRRWHRGKSRSFSVPPLCAAVALWLNLSTPTLNAEQAHGYADSV